MKKAPFRRLAATLLVLLSLGAFAQMIPVAENLWPLVQQQDTDRDRRITTNDQISPFILRDRRGARVEEVKGVYPLSVLLQELKRAEQAQRNEVSLTDLRLSEPVVARTHRLIREYYWDALTRRVDAAHVEEVVLDSKVASKAHYLYVPASDGSAVEYFRAIERDAAAQHRAPKLKVFVLPAPGKFSGEFVRRLDGEHGLLTLKLEFDSQGRPVRGAPYVVPGGRFNELYYWDSYFTVLGLLQDGRKDLARGMADNLLYAMEHYGKVPNANRTYYLTRSQPPFLTSIIRAVFESGAADRAWLETALKLALAEYEQVWLGKDRLVKIGAHRLSRYFDEGSGPCPEVEPGHYDEKIAPWLEKARSKEPNLTAHAFLNRHVYCGEFKNPEVDSLTPDAFFKHDRAVRESGHDTTHRFDDRTADFVSVDLNALLHRYEMDFAELIDREFGGELASLGSEKGASKFWREQAQRRKQAMLDLMWDDERGFFFDYDFARRQRSTYVSATGLYPLWAKLLDANNAADRKRAHRTVAFAREKLEQAAGLAATARESVAAARTHDERQWDYPYGWPPHQMLAWRGLKNCGFDADAERLAYRWLYTIARNARDHNGVVPEKLNVVTGSHVVFAEYGNVGTKFDYITPEGFGWMNASFQVGTNYLSPSRLADLHALKPPPQPAVSTGGANR